MTKDAIYAALDPTWWVDQTNTFNTDFYSTEILFSAEGISGYTYISSAPYQTNGLNSGMDAPTAQQSNFINNLRLEASQRLFDLHCTEINGHQNLMSVYNATS